MKDKNFVMLQVEKGEVVHTKLSRVDEAINVVNMQNNKGFSSMIILFDGYNDIPDEIYEIPQIRKWVKRLFEKYPHILYYLADLDGCENIFKLLACVGDVESIIMGNKMDAFNKANEIFAMEQSGLNVDYNQLPKTKFWISVDKKFVERITVATLAHASVHGLYQDTVDKLSFVVSKLNAK